VATAPKLVNIAVPTAAYRIPGLVVEASAEPVHIAFGFNERKRLGFGHQIDRAEIEDRDVPYPRDLLHTVPGIILKSTRSVDGGFTWMIESARAANTGDCRVQVYANGVRMSSSSATDSGILDDLLRVPAGDIEAVEVYRGPAETPEIYGGSTARCGVVAIWHRRGR